MSISIIQKNNIHVTGNPDATQTVVFGHGFGIDQTSFAALLPHFEQDYKIVLYDNVGGGKADLSAFSPLRYNTLNGYVTDLSDICRSMELENVVFVGHSVSGMIGVLTSIRYPAYFSKLVLLGASPRYLNDAATGYTGGFDQKDLEGLYQAMQTNYQAWASGFSALAMQNQDRPHLAASFAQSLSAIRPDIALCVAKAIFESDCREALEKITQPVLILQTSNDIAVPEVVGAYMQQHITGSQLVKVNAEGHFPQMSAPQEVVEAIQSFI